MWGTPGARLAAWVLCSLLFLAAVPSERARVAAQAGRGAAQDSPAASLGSRLRRLSGREGATPKQRATDAFTTNITATYKGEWSKRLWRKQLVTSSGPLQQRSGVAVLKLRSTGQAEGGVVNVEGEMVLRDGQYVSGGDVMLNVQGVHVPAAGKLMAVVEPVVPIRLPVSHTMRARHWHQEQQHAKEAALAEAATEEEEEDGEPGEGAAVQQGQQWGRRHTARGASSGRGSARAGGSGAGTGAPGSASGDSSLGSGSGPSLQREQQKEVLRAAAHQVAQLAAKMREEGANLQDLPDPSGRFEESLSWQRCEFRLELSVTPALAAALGGAAAGRGGTGGRTQRHLHDELGDSPEVASAGDITGAAAATARALGRRMVPGSAGGGGARGLSPAGAAGQGDLVLNGTLTSRNCGTRLAVGLATAHVEEYYNKAVNYTLMITALGLLQVMLLVRQMEACSTPALASRVSLLMLAHQAVLDAYLCLVHLTLGIMVESLFHSFGTVAFMQFVVFAIFEMRFLLSIWRARRGGVDPWTAQREVSVLYARFYATLLGGILLTYQLQRHMPVLMFAFFSFWWPQIILCVKSDSRQPLKPEFVLGTSAARLALPLYVYACPSNLLRVQPNPGLCIMLVAWVGLQCALLLAQHWRGPRCFIPKAFLPRRYDYSRPVPPARGGGGDIETGDGGRECVICMQSVDLSDKAQRAVTPCNHVFHKACLERWLSVKADCPTCRRALPPL